MTTPPIQLQLLTPRSSLTDDIAAQVRIKLDGRGTEVGNMDDHPAGTAFVDPGRGNVHTAFNATDEVTVLVATFLEAPAEGPLTIPGGAEGECDLGPHSH